MIEKIVGLGAELHGEALRDVKVLEERPVHVRLMVAVKDVAPAIAELGPGWVAGEHWRGSRTKDLAAEALTSGAQGS